MLLAASMSVSLEASVVVHTGIPARHLSWTSWAGVIGLRPKSLFIDWISVWNLGAGKSHNFKNTCLNWGKHHPKPLNPDHWLSIRALKKKLDIGPNRHLQGQPSLGKTHSSKKASCSLTWLALCTPQFLQPKAVFSSRALPKISTLFGDGWMLSIKSVGGYGPVWSLRGLKRFTCRGLNMMYQLCTSKSVGGYGPVWSLRGLKRFTCRGLNMMYQLCTRDSVN